MKIEKKGRRCARLLATLCLSVIAALVTGCSKHSVSELESVTRLEAEGHFSCVHKGVSHDFTLYLPDRTEGATLIVMLHPYGSTADAFAYTTKFHETAVPAGYAVVYVTGAADPEDATASTAWNSGLKAEGNDDVGFLTALAGYLQETYGLSRKQCAAVGFSNGAFMTHRLAVEAGDVFTDVVSVAGMMPQLTWEARPKKTDVNVLQITGEKDDAVPQKRNGSDRFTKAPAIEEVMMFYAGSIDENKITAGTFTDKAELIKYGSGKHKVNEILIRDGRHSWCDEEFCGFDINRVILDFLSE